MIPSRGAFDTHTSLQQLALYSQSKTINTDITRGPKAWKQKVYVRAVTPTAEDSSFNPETSLPRGFGTQLTDLKGFLPTHLPPTPELGGRSVTGRWSPVHLAFLGDAVWELCVRNHFVSPPTRLKQYYESVQEKVRAEAQALYFEVLTSGPMLTDVEKDILRWGHNAKVIAPKRFHASGKHIDTYKRATAIECLVGYLYLTDTDRLQQLTQHMLKL